MTTEQLTQNATADAIMIADLIATYRAARAEYRTAWERADAAFKRYMRGEVKTSAAARRAEQIAQNTIANLTDASLDLRLLGIDPDAIDQHDDTNCTPHYDLAV